MKDIALRAVCERWKDFKAKLVSGWITKTRELSEDHKEPYEFYDGITQAQWETFKKNYETEEFKNDWKQKEIEGTWPSNRHDDFLNRALEKREYPGRVRGIGGTVGIKIVFGEGEKMKGPRGVISANELHLFSQDIEATVRQEIEATVRQEIEAKVRQEIEAKVSQEIEDKVSQRFNSMMNTLVEEKIGNILNMMGMQMPIAMEVDNIPSAGLCSSCQSVHPSKLKLANETQETEPFAELQGSTSLPNNTVIESNNEKVMNAMTNESAKRNAIVDEGILKTLTEECRYFHDMIVQGPSDDSVINPIQVNKDLFTYIEDFEINITKDDIIRFLSMAWLNAS